MHESKGQVLLIHDEPEVGAALGQLLEDEGYAVHLAESAAMAIRDLRKVDPAVVVTRNRMPMLGGRHVLRAVASAKIPIPVVITARGEGVELAVDLMRQGATDCVLDPLERPGALLAAVERARAIGEEKRDAARLATDLAEAQANLARNLEAETMIRKRAFDRVQEPLERATKSLIGLKGQGLLAAQREVLDSALTDLYTVSDKLLAAQANASKTSTRTISLVEFHPLDLIETVRDAVLRDAHSRGVEFAYFVPGEIPALRGDPLQLRAVLVDLCGFLISERSGGAIHITMSVNARGPGPWLIRFDVSDGEASTPIDGENVLEGFLPGDDIEMARDELIDLAINKRRVEALGGDLELYQRRGSGMRFSFELAILKAKRDTHAHEDPGLNPSDVLVVEPHGQVRRCLSNELVKLGMRTATAGSADQAIQLLQRARDAGKDFNVVLISLSIPERGRLDEWFDERVGKLRRVFLAKAGEYAPSTQDSLLMMRPPKRKVLIEVLRRSVGVQGE